ncbi:MAG: flagellar hook-length control protein FliK [Lachnospiraceae bacterium]|nr:flagellar hook-length control protein FliK [Lachnospiraceae bacterium]
MKLSELFRSTNTVQNEGKNGGETVVIGQKNLNMLKLNRQIKALTPGQTLQGEVISKNGSEVQIKLADDMVLSARLEREMVIDLGKIMTFEVRNNGKALSLSPLFANTATDANVLKALEMASLPANDTTIEMTQTMMQEGMSIDRNSLQSVYRDVNAYMDATLRDIISLHQLDIDVTPENLGQLENYKAMQHQLTEGMKQVLGDVSGYVENLLKQGNAKEALVLMTKLSAALTEGQTGQDVALQPAKEMTVTGENVSQSAVFGSQTMIESAGGGNAETGNVAQEQVQMQVQVQGQQGLNDFINGPLNTVLTDSGLQTLKEMLGQLPAEGVNSKVQALLSAMEQGTATVFDVMEAVGEKEFTNLLRTQMMNQWLLEPEQVLDKNNVQKVYERISKQLSEIHRVLSDTPGMEQGNIMKSVTNMQNNVDFMNQLNQAFTYVQLPLKMSGKEAHGELYVYTNKKNLAREDGNVSAFLHLDMENLGPVDVYVAMQNRKVNTKFYLRDDEMIDFIQEHIHILNERLAKRGYSMNCEMITKETQDEEKSILDRIVESEKNVTVLSQYAFDVRA